MAGPKKAQREQADRAEENSVEAAGKLPPHLIYEVIRRDGTHEMARPAASLWWSGIAAGMLISLSVLGQGILLAALPDTKWGALVASFGYSFGFVVVVLGQMQLFTENTITSVLPVVGHPSRKKLLAIARVWTIVLGANVCGAFVAASLFAFTPALEPDVLGAINDLARHATGHGFGPSFFKAIPAGVLVAAVVWMLPSAAASRLGLIVLFTWLIAAGDFTHVVAGSVEMAYLLLLSELGAVKAVTEFFIPTLCGNIVGGTLVFTLTAWGQVRREVPDDTDQHNGQPQS